MGSQTQVVMNADNQILMGIKLGEGVVYTGNSYALKRMVNAVGYKMLEMSCTPLSTI